MASAGQEGFNVTMVTERPAPLTSPEALGRQIQTSVTVLDWCHQTVSPAAILAPDAPSGHKPAGPTLNYTNAHITQTHTYTHRGLPALCRPLHRKPCVCVSLSRQQFLFTLQQKSLSILLRSCVPLGRCSRRKKSNYFYYSCKPGPSVVCGLCLALALQQSMLRPLEAAFHLCRSSDS